MVLKIFALFIVCGSLAFAKTDVALHGEKNFKDYYGPNDPKFNYDSYLDVLKFVDDEIVNNYTSDKISLEVEDLNKFFKREFYQGLNCPDEAYAPKLSYLEYLTRLQVLSYLFQSLREHAFMSVKFDLKSSCDFKWTSFVDKCSPKTKEMSGFKRDAKIALQSLKSIVVPFEQSHPKQLEKWMKDFKAKKYETLTHFRLAKNCQENQCANISKKSLSAQLNQICEQEQNLFLKICSEQDTIKGVSNVSEIYHLISRSSGIKGIDEDGYAAGCLARYIEQHKEVEKTYPFLEDIFTVLFEYNMSQAPENPQGRLYTIGAIKEYTDKGLASIFTPAKKTVEKTEEKKVEQQVVQLTNPEFEKIVLPKVEKKKKVKKVVKKSTPKKQKPKAKMSSFYIASEFRESFDLDEVDINMKKFKYDYIFTLSQTKKLEVKVQQFSTIKSLKAMKQFDKLGSSKAPIPLKFIKFLIDNKYHKNLYNIINVVGDKFFIFNDIDKIKRKKDLITLKNDQSTNFKWTIKILKQ